MPPQTRAQRDAARDAIRAATLLTVSNCRRGERAALETHWLTEQVGHLTLAILNLAETNE